MFNGIIEDLGTISLIEESLEDGKTFTVKNKFSNPETIKKGDSISINGVCTTVLEHDQKSFTCYTSKETLEITNLAVLEIGSKVNLERALPYQGRIDGHLVYGHIDQTAKLLNITHGESYILEFEIKSGHDLLIPKGSVAINGISLTVYQLTDDSVEVMIIPHTFENTNLHQLKVGDDVNLEFDSFGKYIKNFFHAYQNQK